MLPAKFDLASTWYGARIATTRAIVNAGSRIRFLRAEPFSYFSDAQFMHRRKNCSSCCSPRCCLPLVHPKAMTEAAKGATVFGKHSTRTCGKADCSQPIDGEMGYLDDDLSGRIVKQIVYSWCPTRLAERESSLDSGFAGS